MKAVTTKSSFMDEIMAETPGGEKLRLCLQCGTCGGSCPSGPDMDHTPRQLFAFLLAGEKDAVLRSNTPWYCVSCYFCTVRCPKEIPITDLMYTLKRKSVRAGLFDDSAAPDFSETFVGFVEKNGRAYELGLATRYHLTHSPLSKMGQGPMALDMIFKNRLGFRPSKIRNVNQLRSILRKAKALEGR